MTGHPLIEVPTHPYSLGAKMRSCVFVSVKQTRKRPQAPNTRTRETDQSGLLALLSRWIDEFEDDRARSLPREQKELRKGRLSLRQTK